MYDCKHATKSELNISEHQNFTPIELFYENLKEQNY